MMVMSLIVLVTCDLFLKIRIPILKTSRRLSGVGMVPDEQESKKDTLYSIDLVPQDRFLATEDKKNQIIQSLCGSAKPLLRAFLEWIQAMYLTGRVT